MAKGRRNKQASDHAYCWKKAYSKKSHAEDVLARMGFAGNLRAYKCQRCGRFHLGHDKFAS